MIHKSIVIPAFSRVDQMLPPSKLDLSDIKRILLVCGLFLDLLDKSLSIPKLHIKQKYAILGNPLSLSAPGKLDKRDKINSIWLRSHAGRYCDRSYRGTGWGELRQSVDYMFNAYFLG